MTSLDREYKLTKLIKKGQATLADEFIELAKWIASTYDIEILNFIHDTIENTSRPRLQLIFEFEKDAEKIRSVYGFGTTKQLRMSATFIKLISERLQKHKADNNWIVITSFEQPAKEEARWAISKSEIEILESKLKLRELWKIYPGMNYSPTFFFFTNEQVQHFSSNGMKEYFAKKYFEILKCHDEFGYYQENDFTIELESKENFESHYENSWFNYDRR